MLSPENLAYFQRGGVENPRFWARFGVHQPQLNGASVLDFGCGHGSLIMSCAEQGATFAVGLDINAKLIDFACANLQTHYPHLQDRVRFVAEDIATYTRPEMENCFDYILSHNAFEHTIGLDDVLAHLRFLLKPGGRLYAGFGPLYNSPVGDHCRTDMLIPYGPWGHVLFDDAFILKRLNRRRGKNYQHIHDLGVNKLAFADYVRLFAESGLEQVYFRVNQPLSQNVVYRGVAVVFNGLRQLPPLREYCTFNIYCILEKPKSAHH